MFLSSILIFSIIVIIGVVILYFLIFRKKYILSQDKKKKFLKILGKIIQDPSGKTQVIELDKLLHHILLALGYTGTFGEILKKNPAILGEYLQDIWNHHKLRNKLVHEFSDDDSKKLLQSAKGYAKIIRNFLKRV